MKEKIDDLIEFINGRINVERNSYFGKGCITIPIIEADKILDILKDYRKQSDGKWIFDTNTHRFYCSNCQWNDGNKYYFNGVEPQYRDFDYCPHCGAKMKGATDERAF